MPVELQPILAVLISAVALGAAADDGEDVPPEIGLIEYLGTLIPGEDGWITPQDLRGEEELEADVIAARSRDRAADVEKQP